MLIDRKNPPKIMSITLEQIIQDAKHAANRLSEQSKFASSLYFKCLVVNEKLETIRMVNIGFLT